VYTVVLRKDGLLEVGLFFYVDVLPTAMMKRGRTEETE
jgi:hypothetical protein